MLKFGWFEAADDIITFVTNFSFFFDKKEEALGFEIFIGKSYYYQVVRYLGLVVHLYCFLFVIVLFSSFPFDP